MDTYEKAYYLRQFSQMPVHYQRQILNQVLREQAAAERRQQEFARYVSAVARETVNGILDDIRREYPTVYGRTASVPQPKPAARSTGFASFGDPKLWRYI